MNVRNVLTIGATLCIVAGLFICAKFGAVFVELLPFIFKSQPGFVLIPIACGLAVGFLSVAPMIVLFQSRKKPVSRIRFLIVGVAEAMVFCLALGALVP